MFHIIAVDQDAPEELEYVGSTEKFWFTREDFQDDVRWLYKAARLIRDQVWTGEDWAEKICEQLAGLLGLPHAKYELADWNGIPGVVTRKLDHKDLVLGNGAARRRTERPNDYE